MNVIPSGVRLCHGCWEYRTEKRAWFIATVINGKLMVRKDDGRDWPHFCGENCLLRTISYWLKDLNAFADKADAQPSEVRNND